MMRPYLCCSTMIQHFHNNIRICRAQHIFNGQIPILSNHKSNYFHVLHNIGLICTIIPIGHLSLKYTIRVLQIIPCFLDDDANVMSFKSIVSGQFEMYFTLNFFIFIYLCNREPLLETYSKIDEQFLCHTYR